MTDSASNSSNPVANPIVTKAAHDGEHERRIRSFARRSGRLRPSQKDALENQWQDYGLNFQASELPLDELLAGKKSLKVEIGFGSGSSLVEMAGNDPEHQYLGIEVHRPGIGNCMKLLHEASVSNLKLVQHDAIEVLEFMLPAQSVERLFLFFPDPWHKTRHHKRRIVNQRFRDLIHRVLKPSGVLHMATDWQHYAKHMSADLVEDARFTSLGDKTGICEKPDYRPLTKFERRGLKLGHGVWDLLFKKRDLAGE